MLVMMVGRDMEWAGLLENGMKLSPRQRRTGTGLAGHGRIRGDSHHTSQLLREIGRPEGPGWIIRHPTCNVYAIDLQRRASL